MNGSLALALVVLAACQSSRPGQPALTPAEAEQTLIAGRDIVVSAEPQLDELGLAFATSLTPEGHDFLTAEESDTLEFQLFRFVALYSALWEIVDAGDVPRPDESDPMRVARDHLVAERAAFLLARHTAALVTTFAGDDVATRFLNEAHPRSHLPRDTFLDLCRSVTPQRTRRLMTADRLLSEALADPGSDLARLAALDASANEWLLHDQLLVQSAGSQMQVAVNALPAATEPGFIRAGTDAYHGIGDWFGDELYALRALVFKDVSRIKSPTVALVRFDSSQTQETFDALQVGDLILTYTAGYMSDVFIPGAFKHGFVFVGTPEQRTAAGLTAARLPAAAAYDPGRVAADLVRDERDDGRRINVIESVAEGVILNDLEYLMKTHVNRLLVLRPRLSDPARAVFVTEVFAYLGQDYDFCFDFADASRQVCTELIYRTLSGKDGIEFTLTRRSGHKTLSADDIVNEYLHGAPFEFILYADEDPGRGDHAARVITGREGRALLAALMDGVRSD